MLINVTESYSINSEKTKEFLENYLIPCFEKKDYLKVIKLEKVKIPGFSEKNYHKVPDQLLKNTALKHMKKIKNLEEFLDKYISKEKDKYSDDSIEQFIAELQMNNHSKGEQLVLLYLKFPVEYELKLDFIEQNIKENKPPLEGVFDISFSGKVDAISNIKHSWIDEKLDKLLESEIFTFTDLKNNTNINFETLLKSSQVPVLGSGEYLNIYRNDQSKLDDSKYNYKDILALQRMVIYDSIQILDKLVDKYKELQLIKDDIELKFNNEKLKTEKLLNNKNQEITNLRNETKLLKEEINKLKKEKETIEKSHKITDNRVKELEGEILKYEENIEKEQKELENIKAHTKTLFINKLFNNESILFITKVKDTLFEHSFTNEQLFYIENLNNLKGKLKKNTQNIHFINLDGISTKESFLIEKMYKDTNITYRLISGGAPRVLRKIIFYLEGELHNEVKRTY